MQIPRGGGVRTPRPPPRSAHGLKCSFTQFNVIRYHFVQESFDMIWFTYTAYQSPWKYLLPFLLLVILLFSYFSSSCFDWKLYVKHESFGKETREVLNIVISLVLYLLRFVHHGQIVFNFFENQFFFTVILSKFDIFLF